MKPMVIDASMAAAWVIDDEKTTSGNRILEESRMFETITIPLFWYEIRNLLIMHEKRGRGVPGSALILLHTLRKFAIKEQAGGDDAFIVSLAFQHNLSAYDAAYLALAMSSDAILATNDRKLAQAAIISNVEVRSVLDIVPA